MAKFNFSGFIGLAAGAASTNSKKGWFQKLAAKIGGKAAQDGAAEQPQKEQTLEEAVGGLGGYGLQYSGSIELSLEEMKELYQLSHSDEEWSFSRSAAELKALGKGIKNLADQFVADNGDSLKAVWNTACGVYEAVKRRNYETSKLDREIELDNFKARLEMDREMDRLREEDARLREEAKKEEKAKK
jgi:hypothetical protein